MSGREHLFEVRQFVPGRVGENYYNDSAFGLPVVTTPSAGTLDLARLWTLSCEDEAPARERLLIKALADFARCHQDALPDATSVEETPPTPADDAEMQRALNVLAADPHRRADVRTLAAETIGMAPQDHFSAFLRRYIEDRANRRESAAFGDDFEAANRFAVEEDILRKVSKVYAKHLVEGDPHECHCGNPVCITQDEAEETASYNFQRGVKAGRFDERMQLAAWIRETFPDEIDSDGDPLRQAVSATHLAAAIEAGKHLEGELEA